MTQTLFDSAKSQPAELVVEPAAAISSVGNPYTAIIREALATGTPPRELFELAERYEAQLAADGYAKALAAFQARCPQIRKERSIDLGSGKGPLYASLDDIMAKIGPILAECGLSVTFSASMTADGRLTAQCRVRHGRHVETSEVTLPSPTQMRVNDTQKMGAALSYAKRYALCAALNVIVSDEDRDGGGLCETIDEAHIATLREWIVTTNANEPIFLEFMGVKALAEIPQRDFAKAIAALKTKYQRQGGKL